jgi:hypothetical protein
MLMHRIWTIMLNYFMPSLPALLKLPHTHEWQTGMMILIVVLNGGLSWLNAYVCGRSWEESKACGGIIRLLVWCTAVQSAIGFSSILILALIYVVHDNLPGYFTDVYYKGAISLWYMTIIFPMIGAGLAITVESWVAVYRDASLLRLSNAAWNTFAEIHNTAKAIESMGDAFSAVSDALSSPFNSSSDSNGDGTVAIAGLMLMVVVVSFALVGGALITAAIIRYYSGTVPLPDRDIGYWLVMRNRLSE